MPLQTQIIDIPLAGGIDTKLDKKLLPQGRLLQLQNARQVKSGEIRKRPGYRMLPNAVFGSSTPISFGQDVFSFQDELLMRNRRTLYSFSKARGQWVDKGTAPVIGIDVKTLSGNALGASPGLGGGLLDCAVYGNLAVFLRLPHTGGVVASDGVTYTVVDLNTGTEIVSDATVIAAASGSRGRVLAMGTGFVFLYEDGTNIVLKSLPYATLTLSAATNIATNAAATAYFDAAVVNADLFVVAYNNSVNDLAVRTYNEAGTQQNATTDTLQPEAITVFVDTVSSNTRVYVFFFDQANGTYVLSWTTDLAGGSKFTTVIDAGLTDTFSIAASLSVAAGDTVRFFYSVEAASAKNYLLYTGTVTSAGALSGPTLIARGAALTSNSFLYDGTAYALVSYKNGTAPFTQATTFLIDQGGAVTGRLFIDSTDMPSSNGTPASRLPRIVSLGGARFLTSQARRSDPFYLDVSSATSAYDNYVTSVTINMENVIPKHAEANGVAHLVGGCLSIYDGDAVVEHGFHIYPDEITVTGVNGAGTLAAGVYYVSPIYYWADAKGNKYESFPAPPVSDTIDGAEDTLNIVTPTLRLTQKTGVSVRYYRTLVNGSIYYSAISIDVNSTSTDTVSEALTTPDSGINENPLLYTAGGVLGNIAPPTPYFIACDGRRMFLVPSDDRQTIWVSKPIVSGEAVGFSNSSGMILRLPEGGDITAIALMDGRIIVFKSDQIRYFTGSGPDSRGRGQFNNDELIASDVGCEDPASVVLTPGGVLFKSSKGIYLLSRNLSVSYVGAPVEDFNDEEIRSAVVVSKSNQVRFTTDAGRILIYDYHHGAWSTDATPVSTSGTLWQDKHVFVQPSGRVWVERDEDEVFRDEDQPVKLTVGSPWIHVAGVNGFQRVRRVGILGEFRSRHKLKVKVYTDYDDEDPVQTVTLDSTKIQTVKGKPYQAFIHLKQQKCSAMMLVIEDEPLGGDGESVRLSALSLEVGVKKGFRASRTEKVE